ncbi:vacuolar protein sorting protein [Apiospora phragmitis]|uniref:Vacuolar protein sorting protein n=1 Tax=Apiospora phragmitis TaxID=2905665 RepID=A0ABR1W7F2_9PEZI
MEKYTQYRDRSTGISPFLPHKTPTSTPSLVLHALIFAFRLPLFLFYCAVYFLLLSHLPLPTFARKLLLWGMLGIPGIWWVDLQLDGVKRGSLSQQPPNRVPHPGSVIAAQFTSPVDAIYLAAIFDPRHPARLGPVLLHAPHASSGHNPHKLVSLRRVVEQNRHRCVAVFPECSTTNGKGILPFSPSLLSAPVDAPIFPVSMRYTPQDITTPIPGAYFAFLWNLLSRPTHLIRVRIAESVTNRDIAGSSTESSGQPSRANSDSEDDDDYFGAGEEKPTPDQYRVLDRVSEALARLGRNKRVGLTLKSKAAFIEAWSKSGKR